MFCCHCTAAELRGRAGYSLPTYLFRQHIYACSVCDASYTWGRSGSAVTVTIRALRETYEPTLPKTVMDVRDEHAGHLSFILSLGGF